jgi:CBS domain containing-hemolysin-like protein
VAESFDSWGLHFEIAEMDGNRVNRILVRRLADVGKHS